MNTLDPAFNCSPCCTDWRRYDSPTVLRRQGRGFLERSWKPDPLNQEPYALSKPELEISGGKLWRALSAHLGAHSISVFRLSLGQTLSTVA